MSKRLKIIPQSLIIAKQINLIDKDLSIVFQNDSVLFGQIKSVEGTQIIFRDKRNSKHKIQLDNIQEIVIDELVIDA